jgi:hypothetical protein
VEEAVRASRRRRLCKLMGGGGGITLCGKMMRRDNALGTVLGRAGKHVRKKQCSPRTGDMIRKR